MTAMPVPALRILVARSLRAFADGFVAVLLPAYLLALGLGPLAVGMIGSATLAGSAVATLLLGALAHRIGTAALLPLAALLMAATGVAFGLASGFWPLACIAFVGTLNPSSGDVSIFLPLEHGRLAAMAPDTDGRTRLFARYALAGSLFSAVGGLFAGAPALLAAATGRPMIDAFRAMFLLYGLTGAAVWLLYRGSGTTARDAPEPAPAPLRESRAVVVRISLLFSVDSFAGGLLVNSILALWLFGRHGVSLGHAGVFFFASGLLGTASQLLAPRVARRIGLVNTMVFTHIPASILLILAAFADGANTAMGLLLARSVLSQMDVPARASFVMSVVTPAERVAAASFTAVPRSLASAAGPSIGGALLASSFAAAPLVACGVLKIAYDLALWAAFRKAASQT
jgi:MFS family permease